MDEFHFIKHEHLVLRNKHQMCRLCLLPKTEMLHMSTKELERSKIPQLFEAVTQRKVYIHKMHNCVFKI